MKQKGKIGIWNGDKTRYLTEEEVKNMFSITRNKRSIIQLKKFLWYQYACIGGTNIRYNRITKRWKHL